MQNRTPKILITVKVFPYGAPIALRIRAFIRILQEMPAEVCILCDEIRDDDHSRKAEIDYNGVKVYSMYPILTGLAKLKIPIVFKRKFIAVINAEKPDMIFATSLYDRFMIIEKEAHKRLIPVMLESCEWYDPSTFRHGKFSHHYIMFSACWRWFFPRADGVVVISRVLEEHYRKYTDMVLRIPTIVETDDVLCRTDAGNELNTLRLLFAGSLARTKDSILPFFEALNFLGDDARRIRFEVCGVKDDELQNHIGIELLVKYQDQVTARGIIPQQLINERYRNSDYGIFVRPCQRSSNAGFSTKIGEGMAAGTPFIINDTGDIPVYIKNGVNGFIVDSAPQRIAETLRKLLRLTLDERSKLRKNARRTAETDFCYKLYAQQFSVFVNALIKKGAK